MRVLICPLDWGLGHASRMIPVIRILMQEGYEVWIGGAGRSGRMLQNEFPSLKYIPVPQLPIRYSRLNTQVFSMFFQIPVLLLNYFSERVFIRFFVKKRTPDVILSDHRYGLFSSKSYSIFVSHQLHVLFPRGFRWAGRIFNILQEHLLHRYQEVWIPDDKQYLNLSGSLSDMPTQNQRIYELGVLSRFETCDGTNTNRALIYDVLVILSGPEPQRTILEKKLLHQLSRTSLHTLLVRGKSGDSAKISEHIEIKGLLKSRELEKAILDSKLVICRSGYSSVMDLVRLNQKALLIPTPGQTEQELLAERMKQKGYFYCKGQRKINIPDDIKTAECYAPPKENEPEKSEAVVRSLAKRIKELYSAG